MWFLLIYLCSQVSMIIKGLFGRYERWNPVHPTSGAFWGMGVGIGCGVGWGPGFGPEVIGYVGAGCGIGFNVGVTLAGFGIGLPANIIYEAPYNAIMATRSSALELARSNGLLSRTDTIADIWFRNFPCVSDLQREACGKFFSFKQKHLSLKGIDFCDMKDSLASHATSAFNSIQASHTKLFGSRRGKD
ncbi:PREDICTED: cadmium-induced protein AS8 isoform X1 [Lupinus angustifolius]|uniref:cadmium-induced protein AS8 isoform X1 n=2 Tax=Lupinus angustifolius TaxID=3871 RepID=UPI00092F8842|nr:PREDICTED: cadmium-induced protein AS8 isoform X1 [Lupinus angustifolius]